VPPPAVIRIFAGATPYTDTNGNQWLPDANPTPAGVTINTVLTPAPVTNSISVLQAISGTPDSTLYQTVLTGPCFNYTFSNVPMGYYTVTLKFAELVSPMSAEVRNINVSINGVTYVSGLDVFGAVGNFAADDKTFSNIAPIAQGGTSSQGQIVIQFQGGTLAPPNYAMICAVEIVPQWGAAWPLPLEEIRPGRVLVSGPFFNLFAQLTQLAQQAFAGLAASPLQLRLTDNEMHGLASTAILVLGDDQFQNGNVSTLMMSGNRLDATVSRRNFFVFPNPDTASWFALFMSTATISSVTRCVVNANMILNESSGFACFTLSDLTGPNKAVPPQISVTGNIFYGQVNITGPTPPALNQGAIAWNSLNTVQP
jgi:hypothetical protein